MLLRRFMLVFFLTLFAFACQNAPETFAIEEGAIDSPVAAVDPVVDEAEAALAQGRPWQATKLIAPALADSARRTPRVLVLAATAASGWGGWNEVEELLRPQPWVDSAFTGRGRLLLTRAALARGADSLAVRDASAAVRATAGTDAHPDALVLLARALDRIEQRDSAEQVYAAAARTLPSVAEWLWLRAAGVAADSARRAGYYVRIASEPARERIAHTEAIARERSGDLDGAIAANLAIGNGATAIRLALLGNPPPPVRDTLRRALVALIDDRAGTTAARTASEVLDANFAGLTPAEELTIARSAVRSGPLTRAASAYSRALAAGLGTSRDRYAYGMLLMRLDRDREAAEQLGRVTAPRSLAATAAYHRGRALLRSGNLAGARAQLRAVLRDYADRPNDAAIALLLLGDLATDEGRDAAARDAFLEVVRRFPSSGSAPRAAFRAAMIAFADGRYRTAAAELDTLREKYPSSDEVLAAGYWSGRAWARLGDIAAARTRWQPVIDAEPMSYYAMKSAERLNVEPWAPPAAADSFATFADVDSAIARARTLEALGMDFEADKEYDALQEAAAASAERALATAAAFRDRALSSRAIALARHALQRGAPRDARLFRLLYPAIHRDVLAAEAREQSLDASFVAALIRQESSFNPRATSPAGARGLMQLMPAVGRTLARSEGFPLWDPVLLYLPDVNLRLGTRHLASLEKQYRDREHILAAYNAGGSRVARWVKKGGAEDPEMFVERIPFVETRDYVRIVLRNQALYRALYEWEELANGGARGEEGMGEERGARSEERGARSRELGARSQELGVLAPDSSLGVAAGPSAPDSWLLAPCRSLSSTSLAPG